MGKIALKGMGGKSVMAFSFFRLPREKVHIVVLFSLLGFCHNLVSLVINEIESERVRQTTFLLQFCFFLLAAAAADVAVSCTYKLSV